MNPRPVRRFLEKTQLKNHKLRARLRMNLLELKEIVFIKLNLFGKIVLTVLVFSTICPGTPDVG